MNCKRISGLVLLLWVSSVSHSHAQYGQQTAEGSGQQNPQAQQPRQQQLTPAQAEQVRIAQQQQLAERQRLAQQQQTPDGQRTVPLMNAEQAVQAGLAQVPTQPFEPLTAEQQKNLDQVLYVWQRRTDGIEKFECEFTRWHYDPTIFEAGHTSIARGTLKYMQPDKGLFVVDQFLTIADKSGEKPVYKPDPTQPFGEYWICDGQWIFIRDRNTKKETQIELPPQMRGDLIHHSPLPFLFGVKAEEIKQRYWIRYIEKQDAKNVWLEAWPKRGDDAGNYSRIQVAIDREDKLPSWLIVFLPNWRAEQPHREIYEFNNRKTPSGFLNAMAERVFGQAFIPQKLPSDWTIIKEPYRAPEAQQQAQAQQAPGQQVPGQQRVAQPPAQQTQRLR